MSSDDRLVELVVDGDSMAFELLYARHVADALAFARGLLGSREEAEEAVRHSFAAAHAYLADGGRRTAFEPWLYTILDNHCLSVLQRRRGSPGASEQDATVVDIDEWRQRRKLLGGGLPMAPSPGFHDSVMTACGIGAGTATAAAPLLGGALAKVAVVALLAGGAGVAGDVVSDRDRAVGDGAERSTPVRTADADREGSEGGRSPSRLGSRGDRPGSAPPELLPGQLGDAPFERREPVAPFVDRSARQDGKGQATGFDPGAAIPVAAPAPGGPVGVPTPAVDVPALAPPERTASRLIERVKARLPQLTAPPKVKLPKVKPPKIVKPPSVDLPKAVRPPGKLPSVAKPPPVGDDGVVPPDKPLVDVRAEPLIDVRNLLGDVVDAPPE